MTIEIILFSAFVGIGIYATISQARSAFNRSQTAQERRAEASSAPHSIPVDIGSID